MCQANGHARLEGKHGPQSTRPRQEEGKGRAIVAIEVAVVVEALVHAVVIEALVAAMVVVVAEAIVVAKNTKLPNS